MRCQRVGAKPISSHGVADVAVVAEADGEWRRDRGIDAGIYIAASLLSFLCEQTKVVIRHPSPCAMF